MGDRLNAFLIREERERPPASLQAAADTNEAELKKLVPSAKVVQIQIFAEDGAVVGGARIGEALRKFTWPEDITDVVLDMGALSIGIGFPAALHLLTRCEETEHISLHLMIASNPELDARILAEPADRVSSVRGFAGNMDVSSDAPVARIWLPQLAHRRASALAKIRATNDAIYTCITQMTL